MSINILDKKAEDKVAFLLADFAAAASDDDETHDSLEDGREGQKEELIVINNVRNNKQTSVDFDATNGLRAICAAFVYVGHFRTHYESPRPMIQNETFLGNPVLLFFLLSGALHGYLDRPSSSWYHFMRKKCARIFPTHWVGYLLGLPNLFYAHPDCVSKLPDIVLVPFLLFPSLIVNPPMWFCTYMLFGYMITPFAMRCINIYLKQREKRMLAGLMLFLVPAYLGLPGVIGRRIMYTPLGRLPHYVLGLIIGKDMALEPHASSFTITLLVDSITILFVFFTILSFTHPEKQFYLVSNIEYSYTELLPMWIIYVRWIVHVRRGITFRFFGSSLMQSFGRLSYSFYVLHIPVLNAWSYARHGFHFVESECTSGILFGVPIAAIDFPIVSLILFVASYFCHVYIEERFKG